MGSILSGGRSYRGGKLPVSSRHVARLTHAETFNLKWTPVRVITDGTDWCTVVHGHREWPVELAFTDLHYGGQRRWLVCPDCKSRRVDLYVDGKRLACRACLNLRHDSNFENRRARLIRRADAIRKKLGWEPGALRSNGPRPQGMHASTFKRLVAEHDHIVDGLLCPALVQMVDKLEARVEQRRGRA